MISKRFKIKECIKQQQMLIAMFLFIHCDVASLFTIMCSKFFHVQQIMHVVYALFAARKVTLRGDNWMLLAHRP